MADLLTLDELLTTTRSVRKRLDCSKAVPRQMIEKCLVAVQQAPSGGNLQTWGFVVVTEPQKRTALADLYRKGYETFLSTPIAEAMGYGNPHARAPETPGRPRQKAQRHRRQGMIQKEQATFSHAD